MPKSLNNLEGALCTVAYLECAKGGGPGGLGDGNPPVGSRGQSPEVPQKLALIFVTECLNFDVLEEKSVKQPKIPS